MTELSVPRAVTTAELFAGDGMNDDDVLKLVRNTRLAMMDKMFEAGIPTDPDAFEMIHKNLAELDKSALKSKGLAIDQSNAEANAKLAQQAAEAYFKNIGSGNDPFANTTIDHAPMPLNLSEIEGTGIPVRGELKVGDDTASYDEFMRESGDDIANRVRSGELQLKDL